MRRTFAAALPLFTALALPSPGEAVAGPPERALGKMVFDEVADGLRRYRNETNPHKRMVLLKRLARTRDPRVVVALGEALRNSDDEAGHFAGQALAQLFVAEEIRPNEDEATVWGRGYAWWLENKADLRRRAAQLLR